MPAGTRILPQQNENFEEKNSIFDFISQPMPTHLQVTCQHVVKGVQLQFIQQNLDVLIQLLNFWYS
jgi:hypothetical protein